MKYSICNLGKDFGGPWKIVMFPIRVEKKKNLTNYNEIPLIVMREKVVNFLGLCLIIVF